MSIPITGLFAPSGGAGAFKLMLITDLDVGTLDKVMTLIAGGRITANGTAGEIVIQTTAGVPSHSASQGVLCWDSTNKHLYCNNNGTTGWTQIDYVLADSSVTYAKIQNVSATDKLLGRVSVGAGIIEEIALTAAGRAILDDVDAATQRLTLGLGSIATQAANSIAITGGSIAGITDLAIADGGTGQSTEQLAINALTAVAVATNEHVLTKDTATGNAIFKAAAGGGVTDGDKGDVVVSGSGAVWTIDIAVVTLAKMADMATASLIYRKTAGAGAPEVNTLATLKTDLGLTGTNSGDQKAAIPGSDLTGSGDTILRAANENQTFGDMCYVALDGQMQIADADAIATGLAIWMCVDATISANATGNYQCLGSVRRDAWNWTIGGIVYLSTTGTTTNTLTQTQPSGTADIIKPIGVALSADVIYLIPGLTTIEHT